ncbi:MAG: transcription antitermination factor NusB [Candidatus Eisenbacteria bacterium]|nr:transcription antitermination factor NusB [Candidatus Eisenbacteria bacterium]
MSPTGGAERPSRGGRTRAREVVFRSVFEVDLTGDDLLETLELSLGRFRFTQDGRAFALRLAAGAVEHRARVDALLEELLRNWSIDRVSTVVRAILRVALAEMLSIAETPARVILDEAVRLANRYGEEEAGSFANGVLDAAARRLRPGELPPPAGA